MGAWTEAECLKLQAMHDAGASVSEIAAALGRSKGSVSGRLERFVRAVRFLPGPRTIVPPAVLADRDRRLGLDYNDLNVRVLGDPPAHWKEFVAGAVEEPEEHAGE